MSLTENKYNVFFVVGVDFVESKSEPKKSSRRVLISHISVFFMYGTQKKRYYLQSYVLT